MKTLAILQSGIDNVARFSIQIPEDLNTWLDNQAAQNQRSKSAEVIFILEKCRNRQMRQIQVLPGSRETCCHDRHYFALDTPMEGDACNCGKVKW